MASVLFKNMEMPAKCFDCRFCDYECAYCLADVKERSALEFLETRPDWCPLTLVPDHGDLIDRDALMDGPLNLREATKYGNLTAEQQQHSYSTIMMYELADVIDDAPVIIPADKEATK